MNCEKSSKRKRTGILGGTFNPIHLGHIHLAQKAMEAEHLDEILFIPSGISYMKEQSNILPARERLEMVRLAVRDIPYFQVSAIEIEKAGNSYTDETIQELQKEQPDTDFFFLTGADTLFSIESWKNPQGIFGAVTVLAAYRSGVSLKELKQQIRHLQERYDARIRLIALEHVDISSTEIRKAFACGEVVSGLLPPAVEHYIKVNGLYR